jgi:hypothetical protein
MTGTSSFFSSTFAPGFPGGAGFLSFAFFSSSNFLAASSSSFFLRSSSSFYLRSCSSFSLRFFSSSSSFFLFFLSCLSPYFPATGFASFFPLDGA